MPHGSSSPKLVSWPPDGARGALRSQCTSSTNERQRRQRNQHRGNAAKGSESRAAGHLLRGLSHDVVDASLADQVGPAVHRRAAAVIRSGCVVDHVSPVAENTHFALSLLKMRIMPVNAETYSKLWGGATSGSTPHSLLVPSNSAAACRSHRRRRTPEKDPRPAMSRQKSKHVASHGLLPGRWSAPYSPGRRTAPPGRTRRCPRSRRPRPVNASGRPGP